MLSYSTLCITNLDKYCLIYFVVSASCMSTFLHTHDSIFHYFKIPSPLNLYSFLFLIFPDAYYLNLNYTFLHECIISSPKKKKKAKVVYIIL